MRIYNKKGLVFGVLQLAIGVWLFGLSVLSPEAWQPKQIKNLALSVILIGLGIHSISRAISQRAAREDRIEDGDERNKRIELRAKAKVLELLIDANIMLMALSFFGFQLSKEPVWSILFLLAALLLTFYWVATIVVSFYYEKHA